MVEEEEEDSRWDILNRDLLALVASRVSSHDRCQMRLVCRHWAQHVSVSRNDAERIARGQAQKRAQRKALLLRIRRQLAIPSFVLLCCLMAALLPVGIIFMANSEVPRSFSYTDVNCTFDVPARILAVPLRISCCKGCSQGTRYKAFIAVNHGNASAQDSDVCDFDTAEKALLAARSYLQTAGHNVNCVSRSDGGIAMDQILNASYQEVFQPALLLDKSTKDYILGFAVSIIVFSAIPLLLVVALFCFCQKI